MKKKSSKTDRRSFLTWTTAFLGTFLTFGMTGIAAAIRYLFPNVVYEPSKRFKIGFPDDYAVGEAPTFFPQQKIFVFQTSPGIFSVVTAVCTHLGCTIQWDSGKDRFACPCHGSIFSKTGKVISGPAPRPLEWFEITLSKDKQLLVDKAHIVPPSYQLVLKG